MSKKRHTAEQIIGKLREAEVLLAQGQTVQEASRSLGITDQTSHAPIHRHSARAAARFCLKGVIRLNHTDAERAKDQGSRPLPIVLRRRSCDGTVQGSAFSGSISPTARIKQGHTAGRARS
jgi:hypothetical protein